MAANQIIAAMMLMVLMMLTMMVRAQASPSAYLDPHNAAREALKLSPLTWDDNLASYAYNYAVQAQCQLVHSGGPHGENLLRGSAGRSWTPGDAVSAWLAEQSHYHYDSNTCDQGAVCGHYTQIVWRTTTSLGCASYTCPSNGNTLIVCEYDPPGNVNGERPY